MFKSGDRGEGVREIQQLLSDHGYRIAVDGIFGPGTEAAVRTFQKASRLVSDGIVGPKTIAALNRQPADKLLSQSDIEKAAHKLGVDVPAVMAVNEVESRGEGFLPSGDPVILYERHIMYRRLKLRDIDPEPWASRMPNIVNRSPGGYKGGQREHERLRQAKNVDTDSAIESASWGLFQILGLHWERLGYESSGDFMAAMRESEDNQLDCFVRFILADPTLHRAIKAHDWRTFARLYNGPQFDKHDYDGRMADAFARHRTALEGTA